MNLRIFFNFGANFASCDPSLNAVVGWYFTVATPACSAHTLLLAASGAPDEALQKRVFGDNGHGNRGTGRHTPLRGHCVAE